MASNSYINYGIYVGGLSAYLDIWNNSVSVYRNFAYYEIGSGNNLSLINNIFYAGYPGSLYGYAVYKSGSATYSQVSNNCLYSRSSNRFVYWTGVLYGNLTALQAGTGLFANSIECDPLFYNVSSDLHAYSMDLNAAGLSLAGVTDDFDGEVRSANPDIGADEFIPELWAEVFDVCTPTDPVISTGSGKKQWIYKDKKVIASFNDNGNVLGTVNGDIYINTAAVRTSLTGQYYLDRNWRVQPLGAITGVPVDIDLYFHQGEFGLLQAADLAVGAITDVGISQYDGPNENCQIADNTTSGTWVVHYPAPDGSMPEVALAPYRMSTSVSAFSEFYITTFGNPLPVELISFTGRRVDRERVLLEWATATETNNEGFEIWRKTEEGTEFENVGWVDGHGNSLETIIYAITDMNNTSSTSYYYLRQVDHNGESENSEVIAITSSGKQVELLLYPNPAQDRLYIKEPDIYGAEFSIIDASGRVVKTGKLDGQSSIDLSELNSGLFSIGLLLEDTWVWERFQAMK